jgi:hypothetical protein
LRRSAASRAFSSNFEMSTASSPYSLVRYGRKQYAHSV